MSQTYSGYMRPTALQRAVLVIAAVFALVGVLGFVPGVTTDLDELELAGHDSGAQLLGIFGVSVLHNLLPLAFGVAGFLAARSVSASRLFLFAGGAIYLVLAAYGAFVHDHDDANFVPVDQADNWLHLGLGVGMILVG